MQFIRGDAAAGVADLKARLAQALREGKRVLWLVSGGSNIAMTVDIMGGLPDELTKDLTIMPVDERYGPVGHPDSNLQQLYDAGFAPKHATVIPVLDNSDLKLTVDHYATALQLALNKNDLTIAQLGMGSDGHIAGILPDSPAVTSQDIAAAYLGPDYQRITLTFVALRRVSVCYLFAFGEGKLPALRDLRRAALPLNAQPAQYLKELPEVYVFNDQIEEGNV